LRSNINCFIKRAKHANANRDDVANFLQQRNFINDAVRTNPEFVELLNSRVPENRIGLEPNKREKAIKYMQGVIRIDPKFYGKNIRRDEIVQDLKGGGKLHSGMRITKKNQ
jgi:hypothetical protein